MEKEVKYFIGVASGVCAIMLGTGVYSVVKDKKLREQKLENEKLYFAKLTSDQVQEIELKKIQLEHDKVELKKTEAELKKTVTEFEADIRESIQNKVMDDIHGDMRKIFDTWSAKFEDRLDSKVDRVVTRIDDLSDKYGGVKATNSAPTISVVNAPNN